MQIKCFNLGLLFVKFVIFIHRFLFKKHFRIFDENLSLMPKQLYPKVSFFIDQHNRNKAGLVPIKANITVNGTKIPKTIDHCLSSYWNEKQQRVSPARPGKSNGHEIINAKLDKIERDFFEFARQCDLQRVSLTHDLVKRFMNGERSVSDKPFWQAYEEYLSLKIVAPKTLQSYTLYRNKLLEFERDKKYHIDYHTINLIFFDLYKSYILTENGLGWNTFVTAIKKLKFFMNWSLNKHYHNELGFKEFSATEKEPTIVFLTMNELTTLYHFDFKSQRLNQTRDKFCFGCFTGLAFADLDALTSEHINNGTLTKFRQKTKKLLDIELPEQALEIIERYQGKYKALPKLSSDKMNEYIKECCKKAGIDTPTVYKDFTGGITTEKREPKCNLISAHDARRTFITNFYNETKDMRLTKQNAGIAQDKTMKRYMGSNKEMERDAMKKAFGNMPKNKISAETLTDFDLKEFDEMFNRLEA